MASFTKAVRERIVKEFAVRHNGQFNPQLFLDEVKAKGEEHPAYEWFEWSDDTAAKAYRIEQARSFARDLRVSFRVEEVTAPHQVRVRETPIPMFLSPMQGRKNGGGYVLTDVNDAEHIAEHCRQAAKTLEQWRDRYAAALGRAGIGTGDVDKIIARLERSAESKAA